MPDPYGIKNEWDPLCIAGEFTIYSLDEETNSKTSGLSVNDKCDISCWVWGEPRRVGSQVNIGVQEKIHDNNNDDNSYGLVSFPVAKYITWCPQFKVGEIYLAHSFKEFSPW